MGKPSIKLYIDLVSPFGYLGYYIVRNSPTFKSVDVEYVPILLGGLFKKCENTPPLRIKNKDKWIERERKLWARQFDIPMRDKVPPGFPNPSTNVQRLLAYLHRKDASLVPKAMDIIVAAYWAPDSLPKSTPAPSAGPGNEYQVNTAADLAVLLPSVLGQSLTDELVKAMSGPEAKAALVENTDAAFDDGAFGLPYFSCTNAEGEKMGFWGFDHLGQVVSFLGLDMEELGGKQRIRPLL